MTAPAWMHDALCAEVDTDVFYPERGGERGGRWKAADALAICRNCTVKLECLTYALEAETDRFGRPRERYGIFGNTTPRQRRKIAQRRAGRGAA